MIKKLYKIRLKKNDVVVVRSGKYKGQSGKIIATHPRDNTVTVEGINIVKKHIKPNHQYPQGGIVEITKPLAVSKVGIIDPVTKKPVRIRYSLYQDGKKNRLYASNNKEITS
jgi:large subunit ribosomal protein L24